MEDAAIRVRIVSDAATFGQDFVELDFHSFPEYEHRRNIMKRDDVVLCCDT